MNTIGRPSRLAIAGALLALYITWGSTYLAILFALDGLPPFTLAGVRFTLAGWILYGLLRLRGHPAPNGREWLGASFVGLMLLGIGNGGVTWAEQRIPSGAAALIVAGTPAWMVLLDWLRPGGVRPAKRVVVGVLLGLAGILLLVFVAGDVRVERIDTLGAVAVMLASLAWAIGSIASRSMRLPSSAAMLTSMQMMAAGAGLLAVGTVSGEWRSLDPSAITSSSILALGYLVVFGSWVGFSAYVWLLKSTTPAVASTYAYVNPAVAVFLGWAFAGEAVDRWTFVAMTVIIAGVALITLGQAKGARGGKEAREPLGAIGRNARVWRPGGRWGSRRRLRADRPGSS